MTVEKNHQAILALPGTRNKPKVMKENYAYIFEFRPEIH